MPTPRTAPTGVNLLRQGAGEPVVLLHGIGSSLRAWSPIVPGLAAELDVIALDLPGFGESPPLPSPEQPSVPALATAVERVLERLELQDAHLVGNSLGGWIALELGRRGRARSVTALSPAGMWTRRELRYAHGLLRGQRAFAKSLAPHADRITRSAAGRTGLFSLVMSRPWRLDPGEAAYALRVFASAPGWRDTFAWATANRASGLEQIGCPTLIAWGTRDLLLPPRQAPRFADRIPGAELRLLQGLGHVPMSDDPALVTATILELVAAPKSRSGSARSQAAAVAS